MKRPTFWFVLVTLLLTTLACAGGTSGSVIGSSSSCQSSGNSGTCTGSYGTLNGNYSQEIKDEDWPFADQANVQVNVSCGEGTVRVSLKDKDGKTVSAEAKPGSPASLSGQAEISLDAFKVVFEAVDGKAKNIEYSISYTIP